LKIILFSSKFDLFVFLFITFTKAKFSFYLKNILIELNQSGLFRVLSKIIASSDHTPSIAMRWDIFDKKKRVKRDTSSPAFTRFNGHAISLSPQGNSPPKGPRHRLSP